MKIALAGNPNSGKTTMFNELTGGFEKVGNWAGVTVEKKELSVRITDSIDKWFVVLDFFDVEIKYFDIV